MRTQSVDDADIAVRILGEKAVVEDIINLPTGTAYIKTLVDGIPQDAMSINIQKTDHPTDIAKDTEAFFVQETMERYGTPLEVIKQKRATVNSIYYSSEREQIFFEQMGRSTMFEEAPETDIPIQVKAHDEPIQEVAPRTFAVKTLFDF